MKNPNDSTEAAREYQEHVDLIARSLTPEIVNRAKDLGVKMLDGIDPKHLDPTRLDECKLFTYAVAAMLVTSCQMQMRQCGVIVDSILGEVHEDDDGHIQQGQLLALEILGALNKLENLGHEEMAKRKGN